MTEKRYFKIKVTVDSVAGNCPLGGKSGCCLHLLS
jgi:hypothetical protein